MNSFHRKCLAALSACSLLATAIPAYAQVNPCWYEEQAFSTDRAAAEATVGVRNALYIEYDDAMMLYRATQLQREALFDLWLAPNQTHAQRLERRASYYNHQTLVDEMRARVDALRGPVAQAEKSVVRYWETNPTLWQTLEALRACQTANNWPLTEFP